MKRGRNGERKLLDKIFEQDIFEQPLRFRRVQEESSGIQKIKNAIPSIKSLHPTWNCAEHIGWQILRLNQAYREAVERHYEKKFRFQYWLSKDKGSHSHMSYPLFVDYPPLPQEPFPDYEKRVTASVEDNIISQKGLFRGVKVDKNDLIPYSIRFPCPLIRPLLPLHKFKSLMTRKGTPIKDWSQNLLVYELSLAGMKNAEIGRLLFQMGSSRWSVGDPKHPILVKIAKIKKSIGGIVSQCYP